MIILLFNESGINCDNVEVIFLVVGIVWLFNFSVWMLLFVVILVLNKIYVFWVIFGILE